MAKRTSDKATQRAIPANGPIDGLDGHTFIDQETGERYVLMEGFLWPDPGFPTDTEPQHMPKDRKPDSEFKRALRRASRPVVGRKSNYATLPPDEMAKVVKSFKDGSESGTLGVEATLAWIKENHPTSKLLKVGPAVPGKPPKD